MKQNMRLSKYVRVYSIEDFQILYCMSSDQLMVLTPELSKILRDLSDDMTQIKDLHPDFYERLIANQIIINEENDELKSVLDQWVKEDKEPSIVKITVNPTLQCNLSCWYCYENHGGSHYMDDAVLDATKKYISNIYRNNRNTRLILSFFGGEPLLYFAKVVQPLIAFAQSEALKFNAQLGISFTTNGTLLTERVCEFLKTVKAPILFQITLDGTKEHHNKTRFFKNGLGSYDTIIANIKRAISYGYKVNVRFNYTNNNYVDCDAIMSEFVSIPKSLRHLIDFSFHKVWQEEHSDEMDSSVHSAYNQYLKNGFEASINDGFSAGRCYADSAQNVVINYNGLIYKCTARDFTRENAEGQLLSDGSIEWNQNAGRRESLKFGGLTCQNCSIFPICHNGCSQDKMEQPFDITECPRGLRDNQKEDLVKSHATNLLLKYLAEYNSNIV